MAAKIAKLTWELRLDKTYRKKTIAWPELSTFVDVVQYGFAPIKNRDTCVQSRIVSYRPIRYSVPYFHPITNFVSFPSRALPDPYCH